MLLTKESVNLDQTDTKYGWTPLSWAADSGHGRKVNLLMEPNDIRTAIPDHMNQTPRPFALPEVHYEVVRNPPERDTVNYAQANYSSPISPSPSAMPHNDFVVEMQARSHDLDADMTDFHGQPAPLMTSHHERSQLSGLKDSLSKPTDGCLSTQSPRRSHPLSTWPLNLWYPPQKTDAHPHTQSILPFALGRSFITAFPICIFAFLLYILPPPLLDISSFH